MEERLTRLEEDQARSVSVLKDMLYEVTILKGLVQAHLIPDVAAIKNEMQTFSNRLDRIDDRLDTIEERMTTEFASIHQQLAEIVAMLKERRE